MKYVLLLVLVVLSLCVYGYNYGTHDNLNQVLPFVNKINNPALYPDDPYVETLSSFPSVYPYIMAYLSRYLSLSAVHLLLFLIFKYMLFLVVYNLSWYLFRSRETAWLACFLFALSPLANIYTLFGEEPIMKTALYHTSLVGPVSLLSVSLFMQRKYIFAFLTLGIVYYFNCIIGNYVAVMFLTASWNKRKAVLSGWFLFLLLWMPWFLWFLKTHGCSFRTDPLFLRALRMWYAGHYFPSRWGIGKWKDIVTFLSFFILFFHYGLKDSAAAEDIKSFLSGIIGMWSLAYIFGELLPFRPVILLQFFRSDTFFICLGLIFSAHYIKNLSDTTSVKHLALSGLLLFLFTDFTAPDFKVPLLILFLLALSPYRRVYKVFLGAFLVLCLTNIYLFPLAAEKILVLSLFLSFLLIVKIEEGAIPSLKKTLVYPVLLILILAPYSSVIQYRIQEGTFSSKTEKRRDWERLQYWVKDHTPVDSSFIVPPYGDGFRVFSMRSPVVEWIDGAAIHWRDGFENEWMKRLIQFGLTEKDRSLLSRRLQNNLIQDGTLLDMKKFYDAMGREEVLGLAGKYGADYIVTEGTGRNDFPLVFRNNNFRIYKITGPETRGREF